MSDSEQQDVIPSAQPVAPPTQPGALIAPQRAANWPVVIGTIAIVFGCLGILGGVLSVLSPVTIKFFSGFMPEEQQEIIQQSMPWNVVYGIGALLVAILLLVGGIRLSARKRQAVALIRTWAAVKILFSIVSSVISYHYAQLQIEAIANDPNAAAIGMGFMDTFGVVGMIFNALWLCALPVFVLVWFSRKKIETEVADWN